jgi:DNA-binding NarL/FixJ family response regulator
MGAFLLAADAAAEAAALTTRSEKKAAASTARRRATAARSLCHSAHTPALRSIKVRGVLTHSEWRTASMVAAGKSNQAVATALQLSVRTIDNRLQRIYEKLGVNSRADMTAMFEHRD